MTMFPESGCLTPEMLASYLDRRDSIAERNRIDEHLARCPKCVAFLAGAFRTVEQLDREDGVGRTKDRNR